MKNTFWVRHFLWLLNTIANARRFFRQDIIWWWWNKTRQKELVYAAELVLEQFNYNNQWTTISVAIEKKTWAVLPVDDTTNMTVKHLDFVLASKYRKDK